MTIDAFRACPDGVYDDGVVRVVRAPDRPGIRLDGLVLTHGLAAGEVDNDLAGRLAALDGADPETFERLFTGIVLTSATDPLQAWAGFYRTTLTRLTGAHDAGGSIAEFAPIYCRARALARGHRVLDVGSCFGFLPLLLAEDGQQVLASDVNPGSMRLLSAVAPCLPVVCCGAESLPLPDGAVDTVFALHLLEHVDAALGAAVLTEAIRVARQRVVVAVPYEVAPTAAYGHVRTVDHTDLVALGERSGLAFDVLDADGGWLVLDQR
ncbi:mycofactocin oligosaccharide methyltransferase MftM [soil metagenome]